MCEYSDDTGYECPYEKLGDSDYCIFHLQDDNKDVYEFNKGIKKILDEEKDEDLINLNGFYFPSESSDFSGQIFQNKMDFHNVIFTGNANFGGAEFSDVDFSEATFAENANFRGAKILKHANFRDPKFLKHANFAYAEFSGFTNFTGAEFSEKAYFENSEFSRDVNFWNAEFSEKAYFENSKFSGDVNFWNTKFLGNAYFGYAEFLGDTYFGYAEFLGDAYFGYAKFLEMANFRESTFSREANFREATFSGKTSLEAVTFSGNVNFEGAELTGKFEFVPDKSGIIIFKKTYFSDNIRIKADMSKCSFANSNIERVDMTDSVWITDNKPKNSYSPLIESLKHKMGMSETSIKIWEERQGGSNWKELESIYRRLKQSFQKFGDNSTAGKLYYREMECKREQSRGCEKLLYALYKISCGYGENPRNVFLLMGIIIFLSSLGFFYGGIELSESQNLSPRLINYDISSNIPWIIANFWKVIRDWIECLYTSVITFTTLGYGDVHPIGYSRIVASIEAGLGIFLTALFIFVFTRKMLR